ncbi:MAG: T9SS type A sorting domain-containing protein [Bacteroidota bacterium]
MKKLVLFFTALLSAGAIFAQTDCSDIFMSEYVEGWNNNKALELYNPTAQPIVLDNTYRLIRWSNGATTSDQDMQYVLPLTTTIGPFKVMVIIQDTALASQDTMVWAGLRKKATWLAPFAYNTTPPTQGGNVVFWNGDDAISLQKKQTNGTWVDIDIFGEIGVKPKAGGTGTLGAWTDTKPYWTGVGRYLTMNKTLVRKHTVKHGVNRQTMIHYGDSTTGNDPNSFNAKLEYDSLPSNTFDSLGQHWCNCKTSSGIGKLTVNTGLTILPNPIVNNYFTIEAQSPVESVELVSVVGKSVYFRNNDSRTREVRVQTNNLPAGIYLVRVKFADNQTVVKKIIFQ